MTTQEKIKKDNLKRIMIMCIRESYNVGYRSGKYGEDRQISDIAYIYDCVFQFIDSFGEKNEEE